MLDPKANRQAREEAAAQASIPEALNPAFPFRAIPPDLEALRVLEDPQPSPIPEVTG